MIKAPALSCFLSALVLSPLCALAHDDQKLEFTPFVGYRLDGDFEQTDPLTGTETELSLKDKSSYGFIIAWPYSDQRQGEFLISHYQTDFTSHNPVSFSANNKIDVTYMQVGGNVPLTHGLVPLSLSGGLGLTYLAPKSSRFDSESKFSINLGLQTKLPINEQLAFRIDARVFATLFDSDGELFCSEQGCIASVSSDLWLQGEITAGLSVSF
ncbi:hypothetical protein SG34_004460 [Thalassomonas viridans]|uniref:Outer membrane protein beta-barrel domain-containing protein n=1 Tax=Thalassomonas viridans TaxID=137584 RepID=A0AAE9Z522_9GAMM|nr:hypothetical protein [Thalassomonas viridans]WDE06189.1 hypothetical protein SG34_004460 [Thalassomonas viridans]